jgi:hypothetical protein
MFCAQCGQPYVDGAKFCSHCGVATRVAAQLASQMIAEPRGQRPSPAPEPTPRGNGIGAGHFRASNILLSPATEWSTPPPNCHLRRNLSALCRAADAIGVIASFIGETVVEHPRVSSG